MDNVSSYLEKFKESIENDLNTSFMLTCLYDVLKASDLSDNAKRYLVGEFDKVLGLDLLSDNKEIVNVDSEYILKQIEKRAEFKKNKDYASADKIRDELLEKGIKLIDTKDGTLYEII